MKNKYDVIIIGSGIGGLICGCYLAKAGLKVLMVEKHITPGGYCSSFRRNGFVFDSCIHYIKFISKESFISQIIDEFNLTKHVTFKQLNPSDLIISPAGECCVESDVNKTIDNFIKLFPYEAKNIKNFFEFLNTKNGFILSSITRDKTLLDVIKKYFKNKELITIFNCLLMNIGLPINKVAALKAYFFFKEFFLNQSYYPVGGMQTFSNALAKTFCEHGGEILYSNEVEKIIIENKKCKGVVFNGNSAYSDYVVSNADPAMTFFEFIGRDKISKSLCNRIKKMLPSMPAFIVYLGLDKKIKSHYSISNSLWYFPSSNFNQIYDNIESGKPIINDDYLICSFPSSHDSQLSPKGSVAVSLFSGASFETKKYWTSKKNEYAECVIERTKAIFPNVRDCIKTVSVATPHTLLEYTNNFKGACYGLASIKGQMRNDFMPQTTEFENLYLAGHWVTHGIGQGGVSMVAFSGFSAAKCILKSKQKK